MKGILTITALLAMFSLTGVAQNSVKTLGTNDPDAKRVLDGVTAKFKTYNTVKADFVLQIENAAGKIQGTKKGTAYMKGNQYKVELTDQEIFCNAQKIWTYDKGANEVQVSKFDPDGSSFTPQKIFTNFYEKDFLYKLNGEKKEGKKTLQEIELTPTDKNKAFFKILVCVDKATKNIVSTRLFEKNGNRYVYKVSSFIPNPKIDNSFFVFNATKHPDVEVIDLQ
ncbi:outer membrane lipoprotein carrier protein LolA [Agriterribacter sp.]|uniref:LolA family protein n=1 Tax=Agriterribacter sp. TaxID=2821509 RepID=UPI002CF4C244|nr:outer membrane lipoprotein carrier protein LolA [Agriterribacter sp.]HRP54424.1 outer membrane lipoprotein carrier protein LolA [Agriterribacter sp.]